MTPTPPRPAHLWPIPPGTRVLTDCAYVSHGTAAQRLDLYLPDRPASPLPLVVSLHGGGWATGDKSQTSLFLSLLPAGYAAASINYRLSGDASFPAQLEDCKAAIRWLRAHAADHQIDADRIGLWGGSAGGHLALLVGAAAEARQFDVGENLEYSSRVQAVCANWGASDLLAAAETPGYEVLADLIAALLGGPAPTKRDVAAAASPLTYLSPTTAPCLLIHGDADDVMPVDQSVRYHAALKAAGVSSTLKIVKGGGHDGPVFRTPEVLGWVRDFFDRELQPGGATSPLPRGNRAGAQ